MTWRAEIASMCARPDCRRIFTTDVMAKGRPQEYCDEDCRRACDVERKRVRARIAATERTLRLLRLDLARYEPDPQEDR